MKPRGFALNWPCDPQGQGQWKWYKMEEVDGAYKHGRYEKSLVEKFARNVQR